jgi:hypothetical protein
MPADSKTLIEKIEALPAERIAEIEDFVDFIRLREQERALTRAAVVASASAFAAIWSNPEDDIYDALWVRRCRPGAVSVHQVSTVAGLSRTGLSGSISCCS